MLLFLPLGLHYAGTLTLFHQAYAVFVWWEEIR